MPERNRVWYSPCPGMGLRGVTEGSEWKLFGLFPVQKILFRDVDGRCYRCWTHPENLTERSD